MIKTFNVELTQEEIVTLKKAANIIGELCDAKRQAAQDLFVVTNEDFAEVATFIKENVPFLA